MYLNPDPLSGPGIHTQPQQSAVVDDLDRSACPPIAEAVQGPRPCSVQICHQAPAWLRVTFLPGPGVDRGPPC